MNKSKIGIVLIIVVCGLLLWNYIDDKQADNSLETNLSDYKVRTVDCYRCHGNGVCYHCDGDSFRDGRRCKVCDGTGYCNACEGVGSLEVIEKDGKDYTVCTSCHGSGKCGLCDGSGHLKVGRFGSDCSLCRGSGNCLNCKGTGLCKLAGF